MSVFQEYEQKRVALLEKMQTLEDFEKTDEIVGIVFETSRQLVRGANTSNVDWLLRTGMKLAQYAGVLDGRATEAWGEYKIAEMAFKSTRDALMLALQSEHKNVTSARAAAGKSTQDAEVDALAREQRSKNYSLAADMCNRITMFIQTTVRWREQEMMKAKINDRGNH